MIRRCAVILLIAIMFSGCTLFTRTVYVPHGQAVRLRATVKKAQVWVKTDTGEMVAGCMNLPEGWFCLPDPGKNQ